MGYWLKKQLIRWLKHSIIKNMKILILGGTGHTSVLTLRAALERGHERHALVHNSNRESYPPLAYRLLHSFLVVSIFSILSCQQRENPVNAFPVIDTLESLQSLSPLVYESSGIFLDGELIWTHNDSGDEPFLYAFKPGDKKLARKVLISGAKAKDWEAITTDDEFVYIGGLKTLFAQQFNSICDWLQ